MKSIVRDFSKNAVIFKEGEVASVAYILSEGTVEISIMTGGKKAILAVIQPVSIFGEMALLLKNQKRTATAIARTACKAAEITKRDFEEFVEQSPKLVNAVLTSMVERLQKTSSQVSHQSDLFLGTAEIVYLLMQHTVRGIRYDTTIAMIKYDHVVRAISQAFVVEPKEVEKILGNMETLNLLVIKIQDKERVIDFPHQENFLERCRRIHETLTHLGVPIDRA